MTPAPRDENHVPALIARSSSTNTAVVLYADPTTHRLLVDASVTISGLATAVTDGEAVDVADVGNLALGTDGSNYQILHTDSSGDLQIDILTSALPSGAATSANQTTIIGHVDGIEGLLTTIDADTGNIVTSVQLIDDAIYVDGDAWVDNASKHMLGGGVYQSTQQTIIDGDTAPFELDARGNLRTIIMDGVNQASVDTAGVDNESNTSSRLNVRSHLSYFDGSTWDRARGDSTDGLLVNLGTNNDVTVTSGAITETNSGAIKTAVETIDNAISGSEMQVDVVAALPAGTNTIGAVKSVPSDIDSNGSNANHADKYYTNAGAVTDGIIWSPAAGKRWHVLNLTINVSAACTVTIEDDLAAGDNPRLKFEFAANSGITIPYNKEHPFSSGEDAADLLITTTAGNVYVQAVGYEV